MKETCIPCTKNTSALDERKVSQLMSQAPGYELLEIEGEKRISKLYPFKNFKTALSFTQALGEISEEQNHHPQIILEWAKVRVTWWTHTLRGLDTNDFIMAFKTEELFNEK